VARLPGRGRHDRRAAHATHGWPGLLVIRVASESEQQARRKKEILGGPDNSLSGLRARASNKRTVPPTACAFGAPITSNRGHPRQRATSEKEKRNPGWPGQLVVRVASESEQQADSGFRRLFASGEPRLQAIGATPHKGGLRVARTTRCPGCARERATSEPSHLPLAPSAPRLQVIGATRGFRRLFASGEPRLQAIGATRGRHDRRAAHTTAQIRPSRSRLAERRCPGFTPGRARRFPAAVTSRAP